MSKKKSSKEKGSESEITDNETKKKKAKFEKPSRDLKENDQIKVIKKIAPMKQTVNEESTKPSKPVKDVKEKQKVEYEDKSKEKKFASSKRLPAVKDHFPSASKEEKTVELIRSVTDVKKEDQLIKQDEKNHSIDSTKTDKRHCTEKSSNRDEIEDFNENRRHRSLERTTILRGRSPGIQSDFRRMRSPVRSTDGKRSPAHSVDSRKDRSPELRDSYKRGRSPVKYDRRRSPLYNRDTAYRRDSSYAFKRNKSHDDFRNWERNKSPNNRGRLSKEVV